MWLWEVPCPAESCWSTSIVAPRYENLGNVAWIIGSLGDLRVGYDQDVQVYGETFLLAPSPQSLTVPLTADVERVWLNDTGVTASDPSGFVTLNLNAGWTYLGWTAYNQDQGAEFEMNFPFATHVEQIPCNSSDGSTTSLRTLVVTGRIGQPRIGSCTIGAIEWESQALTVGIHLQE